MCCDAKRLAALLDIAVFMYILLASSQSAVAHQTYCLYVVSMFFISALCIREAVFPQSAAVAALKTLRYENNTHVSLFCVGGFRLRAVRK